MCNISKKIDDVINLTPDEQNLIYTPPKRKTFRFDTDIVVEPLGYHKLPKTPFQFNALKTIINEAIKQADLFLLKFPCHNKLPQNVFVNTISAFNGRRNTNQLEFDFYYKWNFNDLNVAKLHVEYSTFIKYGFELLETLEKQQSFKKFQIHVNEMLDLEKYLENLDKENVNNIELLRKRELHLVKLCQTNQSSKQFKVFDNEYQQVENDYHDTQVIRARQLRFSKNLFNSQLDQIKKRESKKSNDMTDETSELLKNFDTENVVFEESAKYNFLIMEEYKDQIRKINQKYDIDLINIEIEISRAQSDLNYFEEMWEQKISAMKFMKMECENYVETVRQRNREVIAKRLAQSWIASARKTINDRKRKAKRLAKKNKNKK